MQLDHDFIARVLKNISMHYGSFPVNSSFCVDSRLVQKGDVFVALSGQKVDGHQFIQEALDKGAFGFILSESKRDTVLKELHDRLKDKYVLFVPDTLQALIDLARDWRSQFTYPVIAITGSVGKTTTKEMVRNILRGTNMQYLVSHGNQNTQIGLSLNMLQMRAHHQVAVFEVGIGVVGEMKKLAALLRPTYALITKIGHAHLQGLGGLERIAREKREIFSAFNQKDIGMINGDQADLSKVSYNHPVIRFGYKTVNQIQGRKIVVKDNMVSFVAKIYNQKYPVVLQGCHEGRVLTALAAITIGYLLQIPCETLIKGVEQPVVVMGRFQEINHPSGSLLINDSYNANPDSMKASLLAFQSYVTDKQKIIVLGDMLELGQDSMFWHRQIGRLLRKTSDVSLVILIGKQVEYSKKTMPIGMKSLIFATTDEAYETLKDIIQKGNNVVLFKASRSILFPELVDRLLKI